MTTDLERIWDQLPTGHAPVRDIVASGHRVRRRRRRTAVVGGVAATVLVVTGVTAAVHAMDEAAPDGPVSPAPVPGPSEAEDVLGPTRVVGVGRVALEVPREWADQRASCNAPLEDTVFFPHMQGCASSTREPVSWVALSEEPYDLLEDGIDQASPIGEVDGHDVLATEVACDADVAGRCTQAFAVPELDGHVTVSMTGRAAVERIRVVRESLTALADDEVAVPFVGSRPFAPWHRQVDRATDELELLGLGVRLEEVDCPRRTSFCRSGVVGTEPVAGTVVPVNSTVTVEVMR